MNVNDEKPKKQKNNKRLSVERIYQKKTQLEHIILRPDSYIGSVEPTTQNMWVFDEENKTIITKKITYTPGLYKIFDEIIVNAADNKQRDPRMNSVKVNIDVEKNTISVWNNGKGIPVEMHKGEKMYVPSMIFGHLLTSSNYDDDDKKVVGGRNGFGAKLCNIFSTKFTVETATEGKKFKQVWKNNMSKVEPEKITENFTGTDFTCITFSPDLPKFKMEKLDADFVALLQRRAYDVAGVCRGVGVYLNGEKLKVKTFRDYVQLYLKGAQKDNEMGEPPKIVHEAVNPRWELCVTVSENGFQQSSFVNSIATTKGGTHVNYLVDQLCEKLIETVKKKTGKGGYNIKPFQVKSHLWVFANTLIENPTFDSQTKENMTLRKSSFGSVCELTPNFIKQVHNCGVLDNILSFVKFKSEAQLSKKLGGSKSTRLKGIPKLDDANDAGTKNSRDCTLIVTEGDSAKALAMSGLSVVGRDKYGVFPLKGKLLNVRDATHKQIMENAEVANLMKIIGLQIGKKYESEAEIRQLRYGHLMIMADQDQDGSHIKGLVINFIHSYWPTLLKHPFLEEFITPIVKVTKGSESRSFFSLPEFEEWQGETRNVKSWRVRYYKGLGTSTSKEGKEYFSNMQKHRIVFEYDGPSSDQALIMAFSKKCITDRKNWLTSGMAERRMRKEAGLPEIYLYEQGTQSVTYGDFINKELILFSNADNERSIPSIVDGLKPGQRKVLFTCRKRNDKREVKVAQLAGSVAELSAYHHGEMSLMGTIINLAQNYVGSNNMNLLLPIGQFGTRHLGGKDSASPRYIFTQMSALTPLVFPPLDDHVLSFLTDDNQSIEPEWYCPIIPMCLINGAEGIGTGYSTKIPNYDVRDVVKNVQRMIAGEELVSMIPSYKNFTGDITQIEPQKFICRGVVNIIDDVTIEIAELQVRTWTTPYKEFLDLLLYGNDKVQPAISDYKEYHTDTKVKFTVTMTPEQYIKAEQEGFYKKFKLESALHTSCMVLFDEFGCLKKYETTDEIFQIFYDIRLKKYHERKAFLLGMLEAECSKLENQARFILEKIEGKIIIENKSRRDVVTKLLERGFVSDPVKSWKATAIKTTVIVNDDESEAPATDVASSTASSTGGPDFQYLLGMTIMSLSKEKKEELLRQRDEKKDELDSLQKKSPTDLWLNDLAVFSEELERVEEQEKLDEKDSAKYTNKGGSKSARGKTTAKPRKAAVKSEDVKETFAKKKKTATVKKESTKELKDAFDFGSESGSVTSERSQEVKEEESSEVQEVEVLSLADRLKKNLGGGGGVKKKQSTLTFDKPAPKKKKIAKLSIDSDGDDDDELKIEDYNSGDDDIASKPTRDIRKKETKKKYFVESDNESDQTDNKDEDSDFIAVDEKSDVDDISDVDEKSDVDDISDVDDDDDDFRSRVKATVAKKQAARIDSDDDSANAEVAETRALIEKLSPMKKKEASKPKKKLNIGKPVANNLLNGSMDEPITLDDSPVKEKKKVPAKKKTAAATKKDDNKQSKLSFSAVKPNTAKPKGATKSKPKAASKRPPQVTLSGDESPKEKKLKQSSDSDDVQPSKSKAKPRKKLVEPKKTEGRKKSNDSDEDSFKVDEDYQVPAPRVKAGGRSAAIKKKVYKFSSDEEEDDDDDFCA